MSENTSLKHTDPSVEDGFELEVRVDESNDEHTAVNPNVIAIAGGSAAGKTTLAESIVERSDDALRLPMDDFYYDFSHLTREERIDTNFDHPQTINWTDLYMVLSTLVDGRDCRKPVYDFETAERSREIVEPSQLIVVDGMWAFEREVDTHSDLNIYVETDADTRLMRRVRRDVKERNKTAEQAIRDYEQNTKPSHEEFVEPLKEKADIIVTESDNETVIDMVVGRFG